MMGTLKDGLLKAGFGQSEICLRAEKEAEARVYLQESGAEERIAKRETEKQRILEQLGGISSVSKFRALSRKLLVNHPALIHEVVRIAHARGIQTMKKEGGGALIAQLLQTRGALSQPGLLDEAKQRIVTKIISKH